MVLGASIIVLELPTAFPYFAAIAAILGSGAAFPGQLAALLLYNLCFVLPPIAVLAILLTTGNRAQEIFEQRREQLRRRWPSALGTLLAAGGAMLTAVASIGLASS